MVRSFIDQANNDPPKLLQQLLVCCVVLGLVETEQEWMIIACQHAEIVDPKPAGVVHDVHRFTSGVFSGRDSEGFNHGVIESLVSEPRQTALPDVGPWRGG